GSSPSRTSASGRRKPADRFPARRLGLVADGDPIALAVEIKFGTDGWRGIIADDFTYESVRIATQGIAQYLVTIPNPSAILGYDTRFASDLFAREVAQVLGPHGITIFVTHAPASH